LEVKLFPDIVFSILLTNEQQTPVNIWKDAPLLPQSTLDKLAEYKRDMSDERREFIAMMQRGEPLRYRT